MRIVASVVLAVAMSYAWSRLAVLLLPLSDLLCLVGWAVGGAVVALAARVAGRWRWAVGIPLLLVLVGGTGAFFTVLAEALAGTGRYAPPPGLIAGVLLGMLAIGPAILAPATKDRERSHAPPTPSRPRSRVWRPSELAMALGVLGAIVAVLLVTQSARQWHLKSIGQDLLPAVEDLVRTDVLTDLKPVTWEGPRWMGHNRAVASGTTASSRSVLRLRWDGELPVREFGGSGQAEGLRADGLVISVPQPRSLTDQEIEDSEFVKSLLLSVGLRPELVSRLSFSPPPEPAGPDFAFYWASRNGVHYTLQVNREWDIGKGNYEVLIRCGGVRSAASP